MFKIFKTLTIKGYIAYFIGPLTIVGFIFSVGFLAATNFAHGASNYHKLEIVSIILLLLFSLLMTIQALFIFIKNKNTTNYFKKEDFFKKENK